ncbi:hypothetical protein ABPG77_002860 [Micractinium sp. CCAP 211/92]
MGRTPDEQRRGRWSFKALFSRGLHSKTVFRAQASKRSVSDEHAAPPAASQRSVSAPKRSPGSQAASPFVEAPSTPSSTCSASLTSTATKTTENSSHDQPGTPAAAAAPEAPVLQGKSLKVHVVRARRLRAADSNGLSDPYCVVQVGDHKASSRTELKTLEPHWNETVAFSPADVADGLAAGRPYVSLRVYDWDLVSADDFLGQCEVEFASVADVAEADAQLRWLPLYGFARGGRRVEAGEIQVAIWCEAAGGAGEHGGAAVSTLCCAPGTRRQAPAVLHSQAGVLYEEPLIACLAVTVLHAEGLGTATSPSSRSASNAAGSSFSLLSRPSGDSISSSPGGSKGLLGGLLRRRRGKGSLVHSNSLGSEASESAAEVMLAGEDAGDEYGQTLMQDFEAAMNSEDEEEQGSQPAAGAQAQAAPRPPASSAADSRRRSDERGPLSSGSDSLPVPGSPLAAVGEEGEPPVTPLAAVPFSAGQDRLYCRLVLGRQRHTSFIKRTRPDGTVHWQQTFVFAVPLPLRDRQLRLELYRTPSSSHKGRLVSFAQVWLHDLLPAGLEDDPEASRTSSAELEGVAKQQPAGRMHLRSTLIDTDLRRAAYQAPFAQESPPTADSSAIKAVPGKGPAAAGAEPPPRLQRLESATEQWSERELRKKTRKTEEEFEAWQESKRHKAKQAAVGLLPAAADAAQRIAQKGRQQVAAVLGTAAESNAQAGAEPGERDAPPPPRPLPQPAGNLLLTVDSLSLAGAGGVESFFVLKCGPFWARSKPLPCTGGGAVQCGWRLSLPVLDPAAVLTLAVFQQPGRSSRTSAVLRTGLLVKDAVRDAFSTTLQTVGKLRVRLSCLRPNEQLSSELPLVSERSKGARLAGTVGLTLLVSYSSPAALVRGYTAPRLPRAVYAHGVDGKAFQTVMERERRRICLRWLDSANPAIPGQVALAVLDTEREAFVMSRTRVNWRRVQMALAGVRRAKRRFDAIKSWQDPAESCVAVLGVLLCCYLPRLALPALLAWLVLSTLALQPADFGLPVAMEQDPAGMEPENESLEAATSNPLARLRAQVDRLQRLGLLVQNLLDDVACVMERAGALLSWQDPTATFLVLVALSVVAALIFLLGPATVLAAVLCFLIRPPALRTPTPPLPAVFFARLPTRGDRIV